MTYRRWVFTDPDGVLDTWTFAMNPTRMDAPAMVEVIAAAPKAVNGRHYDIPQATKGQEMTWDGVWRTLAEHEAFDEFIENARPVYVTDHYGRVMIVMLVSCATTRAGTHNWPHRQKFVVHSTLLAVTEA